MAPTKAPGLDDFTTGFYQNQWEEGGRGGGGVSNSIIKQVKDFLPSGGMPHTLNDTLIALIPKSPES